MSRSSDSSSCFSSDDMATTETSYRRSSVDIRVVDADRAQVEFAEETAGCWIGPLPPRDFLGLLCDPVGGLPIIGRDLFAKILPSDKTPESAMYTPLLEALRSLPLGNLKFLNTSQKSDHKTAPHKKWRPDISTYRSDFMADNLGDAACPGSSKKALPSLDMNMSELILPFELKGGNCDPFEDHSGAQPEERCNLKFENETSLSLKIRGRISAILNEMLAHTFRTHAFSIFMNGHIARLLRADRAGILVSAAIDYRKDPNPLVEFLYRFNHATQDQRGIDTTVSGSESAVRASGISTQSFSLSIQVPAVASQAASLLSTHPDSNFESWTPAGPSDPAGHSAPNDVPQLSLRSINVFAAGSMPNLESLISRARRILKVYDPQIDKFYILKDGWRADLLGMKKEQDILAELHQNGVPRIPVVKGGGDMLGLHHHTLTDQYINSSWRIGPPVTLVPRVHYRFIEEEVEKPLREFKNAKELCQVLADVIEVLQAAWDKCRYLHRDVSPANIMINQDGRGTLIDWEFAKRVPRSEEKTHLLPITARYPDGTGTWYYMSSALLKYRDKPHSTSDDLQSVLWVMADMCFNYLPHHEDLSMRVLARGFIECDKGSKSRNGGETKYSYLDDTGVRFLANPALSGLFNEFRIKISGVERWYRELLRDPEQRLDMAKLVHLQPPTTHTDILSIFTKALNRPEGDWSQVRSDECLLQETIKSLLAPQQKRRKAGNTASDTRSSKRQKPST